MATKDLSLKLKYKLIKALEREPKLGIRKLDDLFQRGKTQVSTVLKNKEVVKQLYESNATDSTVLARLYAPLE